MRCRFAHTKHLGCVGQQFTSEDHRKLVYHVDPAVASAKQAEANRTRFGRTKSERALDQQRETRANDLLDQHRMDGEDAS